MKLAALSDTLIVPARWR
jgi:hypothetical protein